MSKIIMPQPAVTDRECTLKYLADAMQSIRYGSVEVVIHDEQVVQIETRQKRRFDSPMKYKLMRINR